MPQRGHTRPPKTQILYLLTFSLVSGLADAKEEKLTLDPQGKADSSVIEVTARHSVENAKEVPFGISVLDDYELQSRRLYSLDSALRSIPGVDINSWGSTADANIRIRGVGSLYQVSMDDNSVVLNIDGVSMSSRYLSLGTLDVKQIEVLKGPQGTLYGRSSSAGAVNVVSNKPSDYFEGHVMAEYGQDNQHIEEAVLSGPLADTLSARFAVRNRGSESWVINQEDGKPISDPRSFEYRGSLQWQPTDGVSALLIVERQDARQQASLMVLRPYGNNPSVKMTPGLMDDNKSVLERYSLQVNYDLTASRIISITALTRMDNQINKAYDKLVMQALYGAGEQNVAHDNMNENVLSQELRWQSLADAEVFWVSGVNVSRGKRHFDSTWQTAQEQYDHGFDTDSYALYGEVTYPLTERLKLTGGVRQTWDQKTYDATYYKRTDTLTDHRSLSDNHTTGRAALSYAITPQTNLYATLAIGSKPAGFNDNASSSSDSQPYKSASVYSAEIGFKSELLDGSLSLNGALFASKVRDDHLLSYSYGTMSSYAVNVDTRTQGMELEARWNINQLWSLAVAASYLDAEITSNAWGVSGGDIAAGNRVPDVPRWSGNLNARYLRDLPPFLGLNTPMLNAQITWRLVDKRPADPQNHFDLGSYGKLDSRISLINGNAEFYLWGDNLLDEQYDYYGYYFTPSVQIGLPSRGRSVGAGFKWYF